MENMVDPKNDKAEISDKIVEISKFRYLPKNARLNLEKIIFGVVIGINMLALSGCKIGPGSIGTETVAHATTEEPTPSAIPTAVPTVTPIPTPAPTSKAEYEEEKSKLGIIDGNRVIKIKHITMILFKSSDGKYNMPFVINTYNKVTNTEKLYDLFTGELLFEYDADVKSKVFDEGSTETVVPVNESLLDSTFLRHSSPLNQFFDFPKFGIELPLSLELNEFFSSNREKEYSKDEIADIYLKFIPKEYRMYGSNLVPGDPEKRMATYPGPTVSPIPEGESTPTVQQSNKIDENVVKGYRVLGFKKAPNTGRSI